MTSTLITAHNGADGTPEDSMEFVRHALSSTADVMEIDIRRLSDGTLVFAHDLPKVHPVSSVYKNNELTFLGTTDRHSFGTTGRRFDAADIPCGKTGTGLSAGADQCTAMPSLVTIEEVFLTLRESGKLVNCDLKEPQLEAAVEALAKKCGVADRLLYSGTVDAAYCAKTGLTRRVKILLNIEEYIPDLYARCKKEPAQTIQAARDISSICKKYGIGCVNANHRLADDSFLDILTESRLELSVWTVDTLPEAERFLRRGIYNVTTRNLRQILPLV